MKKKICLICLEEFNVRGTSRKYCSNCSPSGENGEVISRRKMIKKARELMGGKCNICGYNKYLSALHFHHINPLKKELEFNKTKNWVKILEELKKCILLCSNCHAAFHSGEIKELPIQNYDDLNNHIKKVSTQPSGYFHKQTKRERKIERPEPLELARLVVENGFSGTGRMFKVSDNAIKKWCRSYGIPHLKKELKEWYYKQ